jgi:muramoyltetrapeptide carboxypeptidase
MMYQLKRSGKLDKLAGLVLGIDIKILKDHSDKLFMRSSVRVAEYDYPVCFDFP